ncbi:MAG TPA: dienelactone hydrolase family protein [Jiangellales bacterium]|nr:dienelactone hydrolase family protein [Jiangellales bacterium]
MAKIALFHSVLGPRPGMYEIAEMLRGHGHDAHVVDQYDGRVFDDYEPAAEFMTGIGFPELMARAARATEDLPDGFVTLGMSNGAGMAQYVAGIRPGVAGVVMLAGAMDPRYLGITWPAGVDGQVHTTVDDPWRDEGIEAAVAAAAAGGATIEAFDYRGAGHLFADPSKVDEHQPQEAELMWARVLPFIERCTTTT